ncbi:IS110 family transposase [Algoriphagus sp. A40]|uniref:IS110 family transposase n=1 Tax=Algoriphagus sp. A40 TaxID=1945863 RepID=UPI0009863A34|nr:IS110 family transposase [Algoriphagus sp. A40]OOG68561.1 IS110 family transposase [Algoriphagus sp. A40]
MKAIKQTIGVDVAQDELVCAFGALLEDLSWQIKARKTFGNNPSGFKACLKWAGSMKEANSEVLFVMEATGVYHEKFAHWLFDQGEKLAIVLPNKISNYMRTLSIKTVTDSTCADAITQFGLERKLDTWSPPKVIFRTLRQLTRERDQIVAERVTIDNQIHAEKTEAYPNANSLKRLNARRKLLCKQEQEIKNEIHHLVKSDQQLDQDVKRITSIPGVGELTAVIVMAETNGFELVRNKRQLTSYAGLDVREKQSGTSVKGKPKISKKGNRSLRKAMHLPALAAIRHCQIYKDNFARLVGRHGIKMKAAVAVQRKLLELIYILFKNKTTFDPAFEQRREDDTSPSPLHSLADADLSIEI